MRCTSYIIDPDNVSASAHASYWKIFGLTLYVVDDTKKMDLPVSTYQMVGDTDPHPILSIPPDFLSARKPETKWERCRPTSYIIDATGNGSASDRT